MACERPTARNMKDPMNMEIQKPDGILDQKNQKTQNQKIQKL